MTIPEGSFEAFKWVRENLIKAIIISVFALFIYAGYRVIDSWIPALATNYMNQHADLKREIASNEKLDEILARIRKEYNTSRAALLRFHDGSRDISRMSFYFLSVGNIVGVATDISSIKDIPASTFTPVLPDLIRGGIWFNWTTDLPDGPLKDLLIKRGTRAVLYAPMPDLDHNLIGVLMLEWLSDNDVKPVSERMKADLAANAILISGYFSLPQLNHNRK